MNIAVKEEGDTNLVGMRVENAVKNGKDVLVKAGQQSFQTGDARIARRWLKGD